MIRNSPEGGSLRLTAQVLIPASLQTAYDRELHDLIAADAVNRLWARDSSLWPVEDSKERIVTANLGWLDLPDRTMAQMVQTAQLAAEVEAEGFRDVVFVALGDSNLAAQTIANLSAKKRWTRIFVLDSTDPATVRSVEKDLDLQRTLFVFANKSGKHIETHSLLLYFLQRLKEQGFSAPGRYFVAVTEEGSYLAEIARQYQFRAVSLDPPGLKGRYSALIHFELLLSALCRFDPASLHARAAQMRDACRPSAPPDANPALTLAAFLAAGVLERHTQFLLLSSKVLAPLTYCVGQLVGVSITKNGQGLIPIIAGTPALLDTCGRACTAAIFSMQGDADPQLEEARHQLEKAGTPHVSIELNSPEDLGAELFKWEIATALACASLEVNPFDEPDCQDGKQRTAEHVEMLATGRELARATIRVDEGGIELYAEGETRLEISTLNLTEAVRTFLQLKNPDGYLAILVFLDENPAVEGALTGLREELASKLGIPVLLSFGPRYLHCFGQVYKGGPPIGLFLLLTSEPLEDIDIPGAGYSFGQLQLALALGDFESLANRKRPVIRLHLTQGVERGLAQLGQVVRKL